MLRILRRLFSRLGLRPRSPRAYALADDSYSLLQTLAENEQRAPEEVQAELLLNAFEQQRSQYWLERRWASLSPREQDVAALTCLGCTNRQMAARLHIAPDTVKGYIRQILVKFNLHSKQELRLALSQWDFSAWGPRGDLWQ